MKIYVLGDFGLDNYHVGKVRGLSAEVAIPVLTIERTVVLPGMAGNVVENLRTLGADVESIRSGQSRNSVDACPVKNRLISGDGQQLARWDVHDTCQPYTKADLVPLMGADAVIVADYGKGSITSEIVEVLRELRIPTFVDTKADPTPWINSQAVLFPNEAEFTKFEESYKWVPSLVLKVGARGLAFVEYGTAILLRPAYARYAQCVNGAGDTVIAAFALACMAGLTVPQCLDFASVAAANVVEQPTLERYTTAEAVLDRLERLEAGRTGVDNHSAGILSGYRSDLGYAGDECGTDLVPAPRPGIANGPTHPCSQTDARRYPNTIESVFTIDLGKDVN